jgi:hypothetical protein
MPGPQDLQIQLRRAIPAIIAVGALTLGACSSSSDSADTEPDEAPAPQAQDTDTDTNTDTDASGDDEASVASAEATPLLPIDADAPAGYTMVTADCAATDEAAQAEDAPTADRYRSPITFAVPDTWTPMAQGSGGSGSVLGTDVSLDFDTEATERVTFDQEWDVYTTDGELADDVGDPWETFDYESTTDGETTVITYDEVATVTIDDQEIDVFYRDPAQAPDELSMAQYKARVAVFEAPLSQFEADVTRVHSFVVTIEFDPAATDVTLDVVEEIIGSYTIPTCTWEDLIEEQELLLQLDLDGDGEIMSAAEMQAELQEQLEELEELRE